MANNDNIMKPMIVMMVVVMMGSVLMGMTPATAATAKGHIVVNTTPTGASVSLNGANVGTSPVTADVNPGTYTVLITLAGYNNVQTSVTVAAGETRTLNASLTEAGGQWTPIDIVWS